MKLDKNEAMGILLCILTAFLSINISNFVGKNLFGLEKSPISPIIIAIIIGMVFSNLNNSFISGLKQGYDYSIKKNSILPLIELNELVKGFMLDDKITEETKAKLDSIKKYLMSYLEEMDVFEFEIEKGKSTRELSSDTFEIEDVEITNNDELNDKVALTTKNGYENVHANGKNILKKAKVLVYKKEKDNG